MRLAIASVTFFFVILASGCALKTDTFIGSPNTAPTPVPPVIVTPVIVDRTDNTPLLVLAVFSLAVICAVLAALYFIVRGDNTRQARYELETVQNRLRIAQDQLLDLRDRLRIAQIENNGAWKQLSKRTREMDALVAQLKQEERFLISAPKEDQ